jgi:hypothetical protein
MNTPEYIKPQEEISEIPVGDTGYVLYDTRIHSIKNPKLVDAMDYMRRILIDVDNNWTSTIQDRHNKNLDTMMETNSNGLLKALKIYVNHYASFSGQPSTAVLEEAQERWCLDDVDLQDNWKGQIKPL